MWVLIINFVVLLPGVWSLSADSCSAYLCSKYSSQLTSYLAQNCIGEFSEYLSDDSAGAGLTFLTAIAVVFFVFVSSFLVGFVVGKCQRKP
jgi:hypothetical protein